MNLSRQITDYGNWRSALARDVHRLAGWLVDNELDQAQGPGKFLALQERLSRDKLVVAFVGEFSRGKSELINALFFSTYGSRVLPSAAGRTTMCPTELAYDAAAAPGISLLPIETRADSETVSHLRQRPELWRHLPLAIDDAEAMSASLLQIGAQISLSADAARELGFSVGGDDCANLVADAEGRVAIPRWRHALINFPHPLLEQGLVILDTPGLNAVGAEPELTLSLLPGADAIIFVLAADIGVTRSDLEIWRQHVATGHRREGILVVLNKIDGLWDGLRAETQIEAELARQVASSAAALGLAPHRVLPVSAQKGLVARIYNDELLLERSRLPGLERTIASELIAVKQEVVRTRVLAEVETICAAARDQLQARSSACSLQSAELQKLRGKNQKAIEYLIGKVDAERLGFEDSLQHFHAVRAVFSQLSNRLLAHLGMEALREVTRHTRIAMRNAVFSKGLSDAMQAYFAGIRPLLAAAQRDVGEITEMLQVMHQRFNLEHGLSLGEPRPFSLSRHELEIDVLEERFETHINTLLNILTREKHVLTQQFFETVAVRLRRIFEAASRDAQRWLRQVMAPLQNQVRDAQVQMKRRLESVKQIHQASDSLDQRSADLAQQEGLLRAQLGELARLEQAFSATADRSEAAPSMRVAA